MWMRESILDRLFTATFRIVPSAAKTVNYRLTLGIYNNSISPISPKFKQTAKFFDSGRFVFPAPVMHDPRFNYWFRTIWSFPALSYFMYI